MANNDTKNAEQQNEQTVTEEAVPVQEESAAEQEQSQDVTLTAEEFEKVREHIETLQKDKDEAVLIAQRLQAEFDNYRRRNASLRADSYDEGVRDCIKKLLPALDSFDRALGETAGVDEKWLEGVKLVQRQLMEALTAMGLKEVAADGAFDPNLHNAVMQEACEGMESGTITDVFQKGYEVKGKIIRHSMVKVAQ